MSNFLNRVTAAAVLSGLAGCVATVPQNAATTAVTAATSKAQTATAPATSVGSTLSGAFETAKSGAASLWDKAKGAVAPASAASAAAADSVPQPKDCVDAKFHVLPKAGYVASVAATDFYEANGGMGKFAIKGYQLEPVQGFFAKAGSGAKVVADKIGKVTRMGVNAATDPAASLAYKMSKKDAAAYAKCAREVAKMSAPSAQ